MKRFLWITAAVAIVVAGLLTAIFRPNGDVGAFIQHPATVAWAQLFGALGAIAATWIAGRDALHEAKRSKQQADHDHIERAMRSVITGSAYLRRAVDQAQEASVNYSWSVGEQRMVAAELAGARDILRAARLDELPNVRLVGVGINLQRLGARADVFMDVVAGALKSNASPPANLFDEIAATIASFSETLDSEVKIVRDDIKKAKA